jgi:hypothetical protein
LNWLHNNRRTGLNHWRYVLDRWNRYYNRSRYRCGVNDVSRSRRSMAREAAA